jgi:hypothetical protein
VSNYKVYILLTDTGTWLNKVIKGYTKAPYNHVSIMLDSELDEIYSFGRKRPHSFLHGGFVKEDVVSGTFSIYPETTCAVYELNITELEYSKIKEVINNFQTREDYYSYHFIGLFGAAIGYPIERDSRYFCSQFVSEVLKLSGITLVDRHSALTSPDNFRNTEKLTLSYEGRLYDYPPVKLKVIQNLQPAPQFSVLQDLLYPLETQLRLGFYGDPYFSFRKDVLITNYIGVKSKTYSTVRRLRHL